MRVRGSYDGVIAITSMVAVGVVLGFLGGAVADTGAVGLPIAAIAFVQTGAGFFARPPRQIITSTGQTGIMKGFR
jgi:hypothetical protein